MSDAEIDPLQIDTNSSTEKHDDAKSGSDDDYLNSVKEFLALTSISNDSDSDPDPSFSPKQYKADRKTTLRRSARMSTSLYKDYSHVTTFKALPSIKLTLSLRNLPKCKLGENSISKKLRKPRKSKQVREKHEEKPISTEELKQILEEVTEYADKIPIIDTDKEKSKHKTDHKATRLKKLKRNRKMRPPSVCENVENKLNTVTNNDQHKRIVLPKTRKKKRVQTETSKKFQKLRNACRRRFSHKDYSSNKLTTVTNKISTQVDQPKQEESAAYILDLVKKKENDSETFLHSSQNEIDNTTGTSVIVENISKAESLFENCESNIKTDSEVHEKNSDEGSPVTSTETDYSNKNSICKHNLPISIPERRTSIAEPLRTSATTKIPNCEVKDICKSPKDFTKVENTQVSQKEPDCSEHHSDIEIKESPQEEAVHPEDYTSFKRKQFLEAKAESPEDYTRLENKQSPQEESKIPENCIELENKQFLEENSKSPRDITNYKNQETLQERAKSTEDLTNLESTVSSQEAVNMIYVKSPEVLNNEVQSAQNSSSYKNIKNTTDIFTVENIGNEASSKIEVSIKEVDKQNNEGHLSPSTATITIAVKTSGVVENSNPSCPALISNARRNTISTADLFSRPSMALKRAISTGIIPKVPPPRTLKPPITPPQTNKPINKSENEQLLKEKFEYNGPAAKRLRDNCYVPQSGSTTSLPVIPNPRYATPSITYRLAPPKATTSPKSIAFQPPMHTLASYQQFYQPPQDLYSLARVHYERLARYNAINSEGQQFQTVKPTLQNGVIGGESYNTHLTSERTITHRPYDMENTCTSVTAPFRDKPTEVCVTQCHPLNKSKTSTIQSYISKPASPNTNGAISMNKCNEHIVNASDINNHRLNYNLDSNSLIQSRLTSPLTISDSSSAADTDIELEVDVVGNDSVDDKITPTYSKIVIKQKPEALPEQTLENSTTKDTLVTTPTISPAYLNLRNEYIDEIRSLRKVGALLLERASSQCSEKELKEMRTIIYGRSDPSSNVKTNHLSTVSNNNKPRSFSAGVDKHIEILTPTRHNGNSVSPRSTSVITTGNPNVKHPKVNAFQHVIHNVINDSLKQSRKTNGQTNTSSTSIQASSNANPKEYSTPSQYSQTSNYRFAPTADTYREQAEHYVRNNSSTNNQDNKQTRSQHSEHQFEHSTFLKEFAKIMYNKEIKRPDKYQDMYLRHSLQPQLSQTHILSNASHPQYNVVQPKSKMQPPAMVSGQEKVTIKAPTVPERPPVIYTTNYNPRNSTINHSDFHQPIPLSSTRLFEHLYLPKEIPKRTSADETNARSPDSGYISPSTKISPRLEQNSELRLIPNGHSSIYESANSIKSSLQGTTISKIAPNLNITDQYTLEQYIQGLLPKLNYCGTLTPEQYVKEMCTLEQEQCPTFLLQFYSYVTKKQIASNQSPISFKIFLEFKSAGKLKAYESKFTDYTKRRELERYLKRY